MLEQFLDNFLHNLFKPLLLFFYLGFLVPLLKVPFEFPYAIYKGLIIYLLISIGWHGGEELASLSAADFGRASGFMIVGFVTNLVIGIVAYVVLRRTNIRQIDAATVAGYYGSDSAGTFVTCLGVLTASNIAIAAYMPVLL
ncbi:MAG: sodium-dependent bicarbonate transport family permease, partial [Nitrospira sp.]|nr:sodium-dependent bicarbonate transport family permease [Nitrospira sp.]